MSDSGTGLRAEGGDISEEPTRVPRLPSHFYFHIPFCRSKCTYCDFYSLSSIPAVRVERVFAGLEAEALRWAGLGLPGAINTVYVGGGTPSLHAEQVGRLLALVQRELPVCHGAEITVEANPDSLTRSTLGALRRGGATRISLGVQSFDDAILRVLGRAHDAVGALEACTLVAESGADLSVDLMCGVPGQSMASWRQTLEQTVGTGARHVSVYPLSVEEGTSLAGAIARGEIADVDPDLAADMMLEAESYLAENRLLRYEVANYAVPGCESVHNTAYWTGRAYAGIGPAAHGMLDRTTAQRGLAGHRELAPGNVRARYANVSDIETWLAGEGPQVEVLTEGETIREDLMLGMRLTCGVAEETAIAAGLARIFDSLVADGLVERVTGGSGETRLATSRRGWLLGNQVFGRIWTGE